MNEETDEVQLATHLATIPDEPDGCDVIIIDQPLVWTFHVTRIVAAYSHLNCNVGVEWAMFDEDAPRSRVGMPLAGFRPIHVDWRSGSSIETFERRVRGYFDPKKRQNVPWSSLVQFCAQRVDEFVLQTGDLEEPRFPEAGDSLALQYLVRPIWPQSNRPVIWYGQGEAGKGIVLIGACVALCFGSYFANLRTKQLDKGIVYVDYEDSFLEFNTRINRYCNGVGYAPPGNLRRFDPHGRLFVDVVHQLKGKVAALGGTDAYVIDSAIPACGGDVIKPEPVGAFFQAIAMLDKPTIIVAHETKDSPTSGDSPFGSQLWRTSASMTVNFAGSNEVRKNELGHFVRDVLLRATKANNVRRFDQFALQIVFTDDERTPQQNGVDAPTTWVRPLNPTEVALDLQSRLPNIQRIISVLHAGDRELTVKELLEHTGISYKDISNTLYRNQATFEQNGGRGSAALWRLRRRRENDGPT